MNHGIDNKRKLASASDSACKSQRTDAACTAYTACTASTTGVIGVVVPTHLPQATQDCSLEDMKRATFQALFVAITDVLMGAEHSDALPIPPILRIIAEYAYLAPRVTLRLRVRIPVDNKEMDSPIRPMVVALAIQPCQKAVSSIDTIDTFKCEFSIYSRGGTLVPVSSASPGRITERRVNGPLFIYNTLTGLSPYAVCMNACTIECVSDSRLIVFCKVSEGCRLDPRLNVEAITWSHHLATAEASAVDGCNKAALSGAAAYAASAVAGVTIAGGAAPLKLHKQPCAMISHERAIPAPKENGRPSFVRIRKGEWYDLSVTFASGSEIFDLMCKPIADERWRISLNLITRNGWGVMTDILSLKRHDEEDGKECRTTWLLNS